MEYTVEYWILKTRVEKAIMRLPDDNRRYILLKELDLETKLTEK